MMRVRWPFAVAAVSVAGFVTLVSWPTPCPIELTAVSVKPAEIIDETSQMLSLLTLSVHNPNSTGLRFKNLPMTFQEKIANHWVEAHDSWRLGGLGPGETNEVLLLIAPGADACRFRLKYCYFPRRLPLGIGDYWARFSPPSPLSSRVQRITQRVSTNLYERLWPRRPPLPWKPRWRVGWTRACSVKKSPAATNEP